MFNMLEYEETLEQVLTTLGTDYQTVMLELTTLPYWLAFDAAPLHTGRLTGTKYVPKLIGKGGSESIALGVTGRAFSSDGIKLIRYCPACLEQDRVTNGELYWHRAHQIPSIFFCPQHHCSLLSGCPNCGLAFTFPHGGLVALPQLRCTCGYDLRRVRDQAPVPYAHLKMIQVSIGALNNGLPRWDRTMVREYLHSALSSQAGIIRGSYPSVLSEAFGVARRTTRDFSVTITGHTGRCNTLRLHGCFSAARAPECSALLAALNIDFATAARGFVRVDSSLRVGRRSSPESLTVEFARSEYKKKMSGSSDSPSVQRQLYWFLRIHDGEWLKKAFPHAASGPVPSITDDRKELLRVVNDASLSCRAQQRKFLMGAYGLRARIRDRNWYRRQRRRLRHEASHSTQSRSNNLRAVRTAAIEEALQRYLSDEARPRLISPARLAGMAGVSHNQARFVMNSNPALHAKIAALNADKPRRQLIWAMQQLQSEDGEFTVSAISHRAGLKLTAKTNTLAKSILAELKDVALTGRRLGFPNFLGQTDEGQRTSVSQTPLVTM